MDNINKTISLMKTLVMENLFPDTCTVLPSQGANPVMTFGVKTTDAPVPRQYNGSPAIPCRVDNSRAFRPGALPSQVTAVDEHIIEFPHDFFFEETDIVVVGADRFVIRKTNTVSDWNITREATLGQLGVNQDVV